MIIFFQVALAGLNFERNEVELGLERMHATTLVDSHLVEIDRRCDSSIAGPTCSRGPISFLDGMFSVKLPEYQAYYFFQHTADGRFKYSPAGENPVETKNLVLPGCTYSLFSCDHNWFARTLVPPEMPSWVAIEGVAVCAPGGGVEFQSHVTTIRFTTPVVIDYIQGYRLPSDFPLVIVGNNDDVGGAQWDILVTDDRIPPLLRKEPITELLILGPALYITHLRVVYYPYYVPLRGTAWHLVLDPKHYIHDPPVRVASYVDIGFNFAMMVPTIAPMTTVSEMRQSGLRLRRDAIGESWNLLTEEHMEPTKLRHVRELVDLCVTANCRQYHFGLDPRLVAEELAAFHAMLSSVALHDIANALSLEDLFRMVWKRASFNHWKLMVLRLRWNKFLGTEGVDPRICVAPDITAIIAGTARAALAAINLFARHTHKIAHKDTLLNEIGSLRVRFLPRYDDVHLTFFAMASGRETTAVFSPSCSVTDFMAQVLGLPHDPTSDTLAKPQLPRFKEFLRQLMDDVLDMEDHHALQEQQKRERGLMEV